MINLPWIIGLGKNHKTVFLRIMPQLIKKEFKLNWFRWNDDWEEHSLTEHKEWIQTYSKYAIHEN